jgi:hypothetical protein
MPGKNSCTCFRMYLRKAVLDHLQISMIKKTGTPARYMAITAPERMDLVPISDLQIPSFVSPITTTPSQHKSAIKQLLCRTSQVARLLSSKNYSRRDHIGIYAGIQEILSSKSHTSTSINRSEHPAAGRREKSTPTSIFKPGYK